MKNMKEKNYSSPACSIVRMGQHACLCVSEVTSSSTENFEIELVEF